MPNLSRFDAHDLAAVLAFLQQVADVNWPGHRGGRLIVRTTDGKAVLPLRPWAPPADGKGADRGNQ